MRVVLASVFLLLLSATGSLAYDGWSSELPHFAGSAVISGASTAIADYYSLEHRALIGFSVGAAVGVLGETIGNSFSWLDLASDLLGAGVGAFVTDRFILSPVISTQTESWHASSYIGLVMSRSF